MSKMTVIQLLNKIANGEEVPKKIRYEGRDMFWCEPCKIYEVAEVKKGELCGKDLYNILDNLNDEVEIIEKNKKIEKLDTSKYFYVGPYTENQPKRYDIDVFNKINEIINYINKEGGNDDMFS